MFKSECFLDLLKEFENNNNSHSYIFYTNDFFSCQKDVYELVKNIFKNENLSLIESDFFVIKKSDKKSILKDEITDLKNLFQNKSYLNKYRVYLIEEAHKLSSTTSNMILKFLEEPMDGVIAFFITDSLDSVLDTIKSRCQIINVTYSDKNEIMVDKRIEKLYDLLFNSNCYISLFDVKESFGKLDRNELLVILKQLLHLCSTKMVVNELYNIKNINHAITMLINNVNVDYVFDYILLKGSD